MRATAVLAVAALVAVSLPVAAMAVRPQDTMTITNLGEFSFQASKTHATAGAHIAARRTRTPMTTDSRPTVVVHRSTVPVVVVPTLSADSPLFRNPHPWGPGTHLHGWQKIIVRNSRHLTYF